MGNKYGNLKRDIEAEALHQAIKNLNPLEYERLNEEAHVKRMLGQFPVRILLTK